MFRDIPPGRGRLSGCQQNIGGIALGEDGVEPSFSWEKNQTNARPGPRTAQMFRLLFSSLACKLELPSQLGIPNGMEVMPYGNSHQFYNARPNLCVR